MWWMRWGWDRDSFPRVYKLICSEMLNNVNYTKYWRIFKWPVYVSTSPIGLGNKSFTHNRLGFVIPYRPLRHNHQHAGETEKLGQQTTWPWSGRGRQNNNNNNNGCNLGEHITLPFMVLLLLPLSLSLSLFPDSCSSFLQPSTICNKNGAHHFPRVVKNFHLSIWFLIHRNFDFILSISFALNTHYTLE